MCSHSVYNDDVDGNGDVIKMMMVTMNADFRQRNCPVYRQREKVEERKEEKRKKEKGKRKKEKKKEKKKKEGGSMYCQLLGSSSRIIIIMSDRFPDTRRKKLRRAGS